MFEQNSTELHQIHALELKAAKLENFIKSVNPTAIMKAYIEARRDYRKALKSGSVPRYVRDTYSKELDRISELVGLDVNTVLNMPNTQIKELLEIKFEEHDLPELKVKLKKIKAKINALKNKDKENRTVGKNKRLLADAKNVLEFYVKKLPTVAVLDKQLKILNEELLNYQAHGLKEQAEIARKTIEELEKQRRKLKNKFTNKHQISPEEFKRRKELLKEDEVYVELRRERLKVRKEIQKRSGNMLVKKLKVAKRNMESLIIDIDNPTELEQEYYGIVNTIKEITGLTTNEILEMNLNELKKLIDETTKDEMLSLRRKEEEIKIRMGKRYDEVMDITTTESILAEIFDYQNDTTDGKIPKEVLIATNLPKVQQLVGYVCAQMGQKHNFDDALSGGLMGLTIAVNSWYEKQRNYTSAIRFADFYKVHVRFYTQRALLEIMYGGMMSGSTSADNKHYYAKEQKRKEKLVQNYLVHNPELQGLDEDFIFSLIEDNEFEKRKVENTPVYETTINDAISGGEGDVDMWSIGDYNSKAFSPDEIVDASQVYISLIDSIKRLMNLFDIKKVKDDETFDGQPVYEYNKNRKLMDEYDRKIFLMYTGLEHKKTANEGRMEKYTLEEIAQEIVRMKRRKGVVNPTMAVTSVTSRWKNIIKKLKIAVNMDPKLRRGLEYALNYIDSNNELMRKMSNDREEVGIENDRNTIKEAYADNEDILNIEMIDGTKLKDEYNTQMGNAFLKAKQRLKLD